MENTALQNIPEGSDSSALSARMVKDQVNLIQTVMSSVMKEGEHYGKIPGCGPKPALLKPGAEKLAMTFRFAPEYRELPGSREEDDFLVYKIECRLIHIPTSNFVGSGVGTCNSREKKYKSAASCWDVQNTLYKMACKRALVAAVLNATAASDIFIQDMEDLDMEPGNKSTVTPPQRKSETKPPVPETTAPSSEKHTIKPYEPKEGCISEGQAKRLFAIASGKGFTKEQIKDEVLKFGYSHTNEIKWQDYKTICAAFDPSLQE